MDDACAGVGASSSDGTHALMANLRDITDEDWRWTPSGGGRSIASIVGHVAWAKYMYADCGFGDGTLDGRTLSAPAASEGSPAMAEMIDWLREGHRLFRGYVAALADDDLPVLRKTNWGEMKETRWLIATMIEHDLYHAGEISHIRALRQGNDHWAWQS